METGLFVLLYQLAVTLTLIFTFHSVIGSVIVSILNRMIGLQMKLISVSESDLNNVQINYLNHLKGVYNLFVETLTSDSDNKILSKSTGVVLFQDPKMMVKKDLECLVILGKLISIIALFVSAIALLYCYHSDPQCSDSSPILILCIPLCYWCLIWISSYAFKEYVNHFINIQIDALKRGDENLNDDDINDFSRNILKFISILKKIDVVSMRMRQIMKNNGVYVPMACTHCTYFSKHKE